MRIFKSSHVTVGRNGGKISRSKRYTPVEGPVANLTTSTLNVAAKKSTVETRCSEPAALYLDRMVRRPRQAFKGLA